MLKPISTRYIIGFLVLTFIFSWSFWLGSGVLTKGGYGANDFGWLVAQIGVCGPSLAALLVSAFGHKELRWNNLRILPILLFPLIIRGVLIARKALNGIGEFGLGLSVTTLIVSSAVILFFSPLNRFLVSFATGKAYVRPGIQWILMSILFIPVLFLIAWSLVTVESANKKLSIIPGNANEFVQIAIISFAYNLILGGSLGEELGWRGFLLPELLKRNHPVVASLILSVVWALWHLPIDLNAGFLLEGPSAILIRIIWTIPFTFLFTWFYLQSKGNLLIPLFLHTSINILPSFGGLFYERSLILLLILMTIAALIVATLSRVFQSELTNITNGWIGQ